MSILAKDEEKQKQIREKSNKDAGSAQARNIGASLTPHVVAARGPHLTSAKVVEAGKPAAGTTKATAAAGATTQKPAASATKTEATGKPAKPMMLIQAIPPFKGNKRQSLQATSTTTKASSNGSTPANASAAQPPASAKVSPNNTASAPRLSVKASPFKPNPNALSFTPVSICSSVIIVSLIGSLLGCAISWAQQPDSQYRVFCVS